MKMKDTTQTISSFIFLFCYILLAIGLVSLGYYISEILNDINNRNSEGEAAGFYYHNVSFNKLNETLLDKYNYDDWICINVGYTNSYSTIMGTCRHEVAHHIYKENMLNKNYDRNQDEQFAQYCETIVPNF